MGTVHEHECAGSVSGVYQCAHRWESPEHVRSGGNCQEFGAVEDLGEVVEIESAVVAEAQETKLGALFLTELQPRDEIGMVLDLGRHDHVARPDVLAAP